MIDMENICIKMRDIEESVCKKMCQNISYAFDCSNLAYDETPAYAVITYNGFFVGLQRNKHSNTAMFKNLLIDMLITLNEYNIRLRKSLDEAIVRIDLLAEV